MKISTFLVIMFSMFCTLNAEDILENYQNMDVSNVDNVIKLYEFEYKSLETISNLLKENSLFDNLESYAGDLNEIEQNKQNIIQKIQNSSLISNKYLNYFVNNSKYYSIYYIEGGFKLFLNKDRIDEIKKLDSDNIYIFKKFSEDLITYLDYICDSEVEYYCGDESISIDFIIDELTDNFFYKVTYTSEYNQLLELTKIRIKHYKNYLIDEYENLEQNSNFNIKFSDYLEKLAELWIK